MALSIVSARPAHQTTSNYYSRYIRAKYDITDRALQAQDPSHQGADIGYHPNLEQYLARSARQSGVSGLIYHIPDGWPNQLHGPLAWRPEDFANEDQFIFFLSDADKSEIHEALQFFKDMKESPGDILPDKFPLPSLGPRLVRAQDQIYKGCGLAIIRGLDSDQYNEVDIATIFLGVSSYIAENRGKQDQRGTMLGHVFSRYEGEHNNDRGRYEMPFHTDVVCDTLGLFTRDCAAAGGHGIFASAWTVYNELAVKRPGLIHVLAQPDWPLDTFGRNPTYHKQALLFHQDGKVVLSASRRLLTGSPYSARTDGIPGLSEAQAEALDAVNFIAKSNSIKISMMKGDMRFMNNMALVHSRDAYTDDSTSQRHLLRLWLNCSHQMWQLPRSLQLAWDRVFEDKDRPCVWDFYPPKMSDGSYILAPSCD